uniref:Uncharacterized protein n=1 Tax=Globodera rostochiensis TaxID=31243 RepID=A0A914IEY2_GLORO
MMFSTPLLLTCFIEVQRRPNSRLLRKCWANNSHNLKSFGVLDCVRKDRCNFVRGKEYQMQIGFKPVEQLKTQSWSHLGRCTRRADKVSHGKMKMPASSATSLVRLSTVGHIGIYCQSVSILSEFPKVDVQVNWLLTSPEVATRKDQKFPLSAKFASSFWAN